MSILILAAWYCYIENAKSPSDINDEMNVLLFEKVHKPFAKGYFDFIEIESVFGNLASKMLFMNQFVSAVDKLKKAE